MRAAHDKVFFVKENNTVVGLCFGAGHCAEHEFGIKELNSYLNVPSKEFQIGYEDRLITINDNNKSHLHFESGKEANFKTVDGKRKQKSVPYAVLAFLEDPEYHFSRNNVVKTINKYVYEKLDDTSLNEVSNPVSSYGDEMSDKLITSYWNSRQFFVTVYGKARVEALKSLHEAICAGTACIYVGGSSNPFGRGGLTILDTSILSEELKQSIRDQDTEAMNLELKIQATGVKEALLKANLIFPSDRISGRIWESDGDIQGKRPIKKGQLMLWMTLRSSPSIYGWFTAEDVFEYINHKSGAIQKEIDLKKSR